MKIINKEDLTQLQSDCNCVYIIMMYTKKDKIVKIF